MKIEVLLLCCIALPVALAIRKAGDSSVSGDVRALSRRYAESTIASDISKIVDSMVQKNFVNFLLTQREKKSEPNMKPEGPGNQLLKDFLEQKFTQLVHDKDSDAKTQ